MALWILFDIQNSYVRGKVFLEREDIKKTHTHLGATQNYVVDVLSLSSLSERDIKACVRGARVSNFNLERFLSQSIALKQLIWVNIMKVA